MAEIYLGVSRADGSVAHVAMQLTGRFPRQPQGGWLPVDAKAGLWAREDTDANIEFELSRITRYWARMGDPAMVSWRRLSDAEHRMFDENRAHRNALEDVGGKIEHNMEKARVLHKELLRHQGIEQLLILDGKWTGATAQGKTADAEAIEAERQTIRDTMNDPRIDAAATLDDLKQIALS
jgi:hypothetical protein